VGPGGPAAAARGLLIGRASAISRGVFLTPISKFLTAPVTSSAHRIPITRQRPRNSGSGAFGSDGAPSQGVPLGVYIIDAGL